MYGWDLTKLVIIISGALSLSACVWGRGGGLLPLREGLASLWLCIAWYLAYVGVLSMPSLPHRYFLGINLNDVMAVIFLLPQN